MPECAWSEAESGFMYKFSSSKTFLNALTNYLILKSDSDFESSNVSTIEPRIDKKVNEDNTPTGFEYIIIEKCDKRFLDVLPNDDDIAIYVSNHQECLKDTMKLVRKAEAILGLHENSLDNNIHFHVDYAVDEYIPIFKPIIQDSLGTEYDKRYVNEQSKVDLGVFGQSITELKEVISNDEKNSGLTVEQIARVIDNVALRAEQAPEYFTTQIMNDYENRNHKQSKGNIDARHDYYVRKRSKAKNLKSIFW